MLIMFILISGFLEIFQFGGDHKNTMLLIYYGQIILPSVQLSSMKQPLPHISYFPFPNPSPFLANHQKISF